MNTTKLMLLIVFLATLLSASASVAQHDGDGHTFNSDDFQNHLFEATKSFNSGEETEAHISLQAALEMTRVPFSHQQWEQAIAVFTIWLNHYEGLFPGDSMNSCTPESYLALALAQDGQYSEAMSRAEKAVALLVKGPAPDNSMAVILLHNCGKAALLAGNMDLAQSWLSSALANADKLPNQAFLIRLSVAKTWIDYLLEAHRIEQARQVSDKLIQLLELAKDEDPNLTEAFAALNQAHQIRQGPNPNYMDVAGLMGYSHELMAQYLGADNRFLITLEIERAQALLINGNQWTGIRHLMEQALERMGKHPVYYRDLRAGCYGVLGMALYELGDFERAEENLLKGISLFEEDSMQNDQKYLNAVTNFCGFMASRGKRHELCR